MSTCPCCDNQLLRHISHGGLYGFCRTCWQEMPLISLNSPLEAAVAAHHGPNAYNSLVSAKRLGRVAPGVGIGMSAGTGAGIRQD
jgi:hypothetical protein